MQILNTHARYIERTFYFPRNGYRVWTESLDQYVNGHLNFDCTFGEFERQERELLIQVMRRISMIPPRGNRSAGFAMVMLCCHLAHVCRISDAAAFRIVSACYEYQSQGGPTLKPPVSNLNSFRVTKQRLHSLLGCE